jgi:hypothetical protein
VSLLFVKVSVLEVKVSVVVELLVVPELPEPVDVLFMEELSDWESEPVAEEVVSHEAKPITSRTAKMMLFIMYNLICFKVCNVCVIILFNIPANIKHAGFTFDRYDLIPL